MKALRSDNGVDYISDELKTFYAKEGIRQELTTPHNPQKNVVAEREKKIMMGAAWVMLHDQTYLCTYGLKQETQRSICRIGVFIIFLA